MYRGRLVALATAVAVLAIPGGARAASLEFVNVEIDRTGMLFPEQEGGKFPLWGRSEAPVVRKPKAPAPTGVD
jgi:hypothetical protein